MKFNKDKFEELAISPKSDFFDEVDKMIANEDDRLANAKIAMRLFDYMEERLLSRKQLAEQLNISTQYLSKILTGKVNITVGKAVTYGNRIDIALVNIPQRSNRPKMQAIRYKSISTHQTSLLYSGNNEYSSLS